MRKKFKLKLKLIVTRKYFIKISKQNKAKSYVGEWRAAKLAIAITNGLKFKFNVNQINKKKLLNYWSHKSQDINCIATGFYGTTT